MTQPPGQEYVGKLIELHDKNERWRKPQLVRIIDVEVAPHLYKPNATEVWFWAKFG